MFLSYHDGKYLGYNSKTKLYRWEYKIVDSEFEEIGESDHSEEQGVGDGMGVGVIDTYEKRKLNVAANLIRAFIWSSKKDDWPISDIVKQNKLRNPKFAKYEKDIEKYLLLI